MAEKFIVGLVGAPFGLKGFVKIKSLSGEFEHLLKIKTVTVRKEQKERVLQVEESEIIGGEPGQGRTKGKFAAVIMRFSGFETPEMAKTLNGAELLADREHAAPLYSDEFYVEDLKNIEILSPDNEVLGKIVDIIEGGGGDLAEIKLNSGEIKLIPFRKEFFSDINPKKGNATLQNLWILE